MPKPTDVRPVATEIYLLPVETRVPLKFGRETITHSVCLRVRLTVADARGRRAEGWGETLLSVTWAWPGALAYQERYEAMEQLCRALAGAWARFDAAGHPMEVGNGFAEQALPALLVQANAERGPDAEPMPWLAALVCCSPFDLALHDAYGKLHGRHVYETYNADFMNADLSYYLRPARDAAVSFAGKYPADYLLFPRPNRLPAWHLVGGLDLLDASERTGSEPDDGYPVLLGDWIERDGLTCLKVKLRGDDAAWDYDRIARVGRLATRGGAHWLSCDFNGTVTDPAYVNAILDRLLWEEPRTYGMILYVEQPFPYDLEAHRIDARSVSARKPLFMDESAHDWHLIHLGRGLGWTGVALKTCKTQTGALLSLCWAKAHGMTLMVQDLTNLMLAQIPHVLLAAHAGTVMGVETNAPQFCPEASRPEAIVHPGLYHRCNGAVDLSTISGPGFGYRVGEIRRELPPAACVVG
ncbi:MAG: mandelate racemase/muconate lactonizing enzyme family protein [Armatimonadetes bacterium]|nr:mandelate racemase/muconate lactonizing enzyme family protein [Armatimonadota bacterium]